MRPPVSLIVYGDPVPQPRPRITARGSFAHAYTPKKHPVHAYRSEIQRAWNDPRLVLPHEPFTGPVAVSIVWHFARPASQLRKDGTPKPSAPAYPRPDVDNLAKAVLDALTDAGAWGDDSQVVALTVRKKWSQIPHTLITIAQTEPQMKHHLDTTVRPFIGKELVSIMRRDASSVYLAFFCCESASMTKVVLDVVGDCCSTSIFYGIDRGNAEGGKLLSIEEFCSENVDTEDDALARAEAEGYGDCMEYPDVIKVWNVVIKTTKGTAIVRHVNNSNGFYDGETRYRVIR